MEDQVLESSWQCKVLFNFELYTLHILTPWHLTVRHLLKRCTGALQLLSKNRNRSRRQIPKVEVDSIVNKSNPFKSQLRTIDDLIYKA